MSQRIPRFVGGELSFLELGSILVGSSGGCVKFLLEALHKST